MKDLLFKLCIYPTKKFLFSNHATRLAYLAENQVHMNLTSKCPLLREGFLFVRADNFKHPNLRLRLRYEN